MADEFRKLPSVKTITVVTGYNLFLDGILAASLARQPPQRTAASGHYRFRRDRTRRRRPGQVPVAFVTVDPAQRASVRKEDLAAWCREHMAMYKVPEIRIVDSLPLTAIGKVRKEELSKLS
jgi:acyl-CoA synthetase (AMP-forming)/AMP-acid ligase II